MKKVYGFYLGLIIISLQMTFSKSQVCSYVLAVCRAHMNTLGMFLEAFTLEGSEAVMIQVQLALLSYCTGKFGEVMMPLGPRS